MEDKIIKAQELLMVRNNTQTKVILNIEIFLQRNAKVKISDLLEDLQFSSIKDITALMSIDVTNDEIDRQFTFRMALLAMREEVRPDGT